MSTAIFRQPSPAEAELRLRRIELEALRATLAAQELALGDLRHHLISFEGRYLRQVGVLYRQLDEWDRRLAALHAHHASLEALEAELAADSAADFDSIESPEPHPATPLDFEALKSLFRELVKRIHPDRATSARDEHHRTRLMAQANDAFRRRDSILLQRLLDGFSDNLAATPAAELARVLHQIQLVEQAILHIEAAHQALRRSEHAQLEQQVIAAAHQGRDLLAEMAARVKGQIGIAMTRYERELHRIRHPPRARPTNRLTSEATPSR